MNNYKLVTSIFLKLERNKKIEFFLLSIFSLVTSIFEVLSIGIVVPFLSVLFNLSLFKSKFPEISLLFQTDEELLLAMTLIFVSLIFLSGTIRFLLFVWQIKFSNTLGLDFGIKILNNFLSQDYLSFIQTNNSKRISALTIKLNQVVNQIILATLRISYISIFTFLLLIVFIIYMPIDIMLIFLFIFIIYFTINKFFSNKLIIYGNLINDHTNNIIKLLNEAFGSHKDVIVFDLKNVVLDEYKLSEENLRDSIKKLKIIGAFPKYFIESIGIVSIVLFAYNNIDSTSSKNIILPTIGFLLLGMQRLLPLAQELHHNITEFKGGLGVAKEIDNFLSYNYQNNNYKTDNSFKFNTFSANNLSFSYTPDNIIFSDLNFKFSKSQIIGFYGGSGSGKTTLMDIIMGLVDSHSGSIFINDQFFSNIKNTWLNNIAHVSQNIYLSDKSIAENIALKHALNQLDILKINDLVKLCELEDLINILPNGIYTSVGENGTFLSGGQKQRIALARALFREPEVLFLDEFTSALDSEIENKIFITINNLRLKYGTTVLFITHKLEMLQYADIKIELNQLK
jgi:ABC-type multidrug transport system fused ATPase/permease subunit